MEDRAPRPRGILVAVEEAGRSLREHEEAVLTLLLSVEFAGAKELRDQLPDVKVVGHWTATSPSINLRTSQTASRAPLTDGPIPVRAINLGRGEEPMGELLVWVEAGHLSALEYAWVTDDMPVALPPVERIRVEPIE
jgi:hypothetical protein